MGKLKRNGHFIINTLVVLVLSGCVNNGNDMEQKNAEKANDIEKNANMITMSANSNQDQVQNIEYQAIYNAVDWEEQTFSCGTFFDNVAYIIGWKNESTNKEGKVKRTYMLAKQQYGEESIEYTELADIPENLSINNIIVSDGGICLIAEEIATKTNPSPMASFLLDCQENGTIANISTMHDKSEVEDKIALTKEKIRGSLKKDENRIYREEPDTGNIYEVCNLSELGIQSELVYEFAEGENGVLGLISGRQGDSDVDIVWLEQKEVKEINKDEQASILTIACLEADDLLNDTIAAYNRSGSKYSIKIKEYFDPYQTGASKEDALKRLNADLSEGLAGDMFDFVSVQDYMSRKEYGELGLFEDLNSWIDKDQIICRNDYLEALWNANEIDGKLYNLVPLYEINTKIGAAEYFENGKLLSVNKMLEDENPVSIFGTHYTRSDFWHDVSVFWLSQDDNIFLNNFQLLQQTLKFAKQLPENREEIWGVENNNEMYAHTMLLQTTGWLYGEGMRRDLSAYRHVAALLGQDSSYEKMENVLQQLEDGIDEDDVKMLGSYAADVELVGFPAFSGNGSSFVNRISLGMCVSSKNKEEVWEFYKYLLSDEAQESRGEFHINTFPTKRSVWESDCEKMLSPENMEVCWIGSVLEEEAYEVVVPPLTEKMILNIERLQEQITCIDEVDPDLMQILIEESEKYCCGQSELEQTAKTIEERLRIYQSESGL